MAFTPNILLILKDEKTDLISKLLTVMLSKVENPFWATLVKGPMYGSLALGTIRIALGPSNVTNGKHINLNVWEGKRFF